MRLTRLGLVTWGVLLGVASTTLVGWLGPEGEPGNRTLSTNNLRQVALEAAWYCGCEGRGATIHQPAQGPSYGWNVSTGPTVLLSADGSVMEGPLDWIEEPWRSEPR